MQMMLQAFCSDSALWFLCRGFMGENGLDRCQTKRISALVQPGIEHFMVFCLILFQRSFRLGPNRYFAVIRQGLRRPDDLAPVFVSC